MTLARQFENESRKKGIQKGILNTAKNMLKYGATLDFVKKTTGLTKKDIETISKKK